MGYQVIAYICNEAINIYTNIGGEKKYRGKNINAYRYVIKKEISVRNYIILLAKWSSVRNY